MAVEVPNVKFDDPDLYVVWLYREVNILSNVLLAMAYYKKHAGARWPKVVCVRDGNRLGFSFGGDTELRTTNWMLINALYMSLYDPHSERHRDKRTPTTFDGIRQSIDDTTMFRKRENAKRRKK